MRIRSAQREYGSIQVIGHIWQPGIGPCAIERNLSDYDIGNIEQPITRETVLDWAYLHLGDFQDIIDFSAFIQAGEAIEIPWQSEESEFTYLDCMFPSDEPCACGDCEDCA